jgi:thiol reductant ABC exporter CydC subunit
VTSPVLDPLTDPIGAGDVVEHATVPSSPGRVLRRLLAVFGRLQWWIVAAALLSAVTLAAGIGLISMAGYLISRSALVDTTSTLTLAIVGVRFFAVVRAVGRYLERYIGHLGTFRMLTRTRSWFFAGIEPLAPAALDEQRRGDVLTRMVDDVETLQDLPLRVLAPPLAAALAGGVGAVVLGALDPVLAAVLVAFLVLSGVVLPVASRRTTRAHAARLSADRALANAVAVEGVGALADLVAYGREDLLVVRSAELTEQRSRTERSLARARATNVAISGVLGATAVVTTLALAVQLLADGRLDGVLLAVVPLTVIATYEAVAPLASAYEHLDHSAVAAERLFQVVDRSPAVSEPPSDVPVPVPSGAGRVEFDAVWFRYRPEGPAVLTDASFTIPAGSRVAVVGPSGAGKSTIAALLLRFWEPQTGTIRIDGVDLAAMGSDAARTAVAVVAQHDHLFDTTIRDNLRLGDPDADDERLWAVLGAADLASVVEALPGGLDARAGEDGRRLSGGERQRLLVARALLAESSVLVLDEATAHVDPATEARVLAGVRAWRGDRTTVHVCHDPGPLGPVDVLLRVEHGTVTSEAGSAGSADR